MLCCKYKLTHTKDKGHTRIKKYTTRITVFSCTWIIFMVCVCVCVGKQRERFSTISPSLSQSFYFPIFFRPKSHAVCTIYIGVARLYSSLCTGQEIAWKEVETFPIETVFGRAENRFVGSRLRVLSRQMSFDTLRTGQLSAMSGRRVEPLNRTYAVLWKNMSNCPEKRL